MLTAFVRHGNDTTKMFQAASDLAAEWSDPEAVLWLDLEQPTEDEVRAVDKVIDLDDEAWDDCLHGEQRPRIDEYDDYLFLVAYSLITPGQGPDGRPRKLAAFCGGRFLLTVHRESIPSVNRLKARCRQHAAQLLQSGVDHLLYNILDKMTDNYLSVSEAYEETIEELEDRSQRPDVDDTVLQEFTDLRRRLLDLRRIATTQLELIEPISAGEYDYISEALGRRFAHVRDHLLKVVEHVDRLRELAGGIRDNYHAALAIRTNAIMRTLTVFASVLLPLSLVAGIYGMNLPIWPSSKQPCSFWTVLGAMAVLAAGLLWYFRRKRWV